LNDDELLRYSRHILLEDLGIEGQEALIKGRALVIGAGGLGCTAALFLASSGVGQITLVDHDTVDLTNLQRQIAHTTSSITEPKVSSLANSLRAINPLVQVNPLHERCTPELLLELLSSNGVDVVLDCTDNFKTRHVINAACTRFATPLVSGSALKMDGQLTSFDKRLAHSPCYACLFPPNEAPAEDNCATMGVIAPLVGMIGSAQALEAIKILTQIGQPMIGRLAMFSALQFKWSQIGYSKNPSCCVCAAKD
jgi:molybdopterin/thiamine biosynthesis adenylyltransferase